MRGADGVQIAVERVDDGQQVARVAVGNAAADERGVLPLGDETPLQVVRQQIDVFFQGRDIVGALFLREPAA